MYRCELLDIIITELNVYLMCSRRLFPALLFPIKERLVRSRLLKLLIALPIVEYINHINHITARLHIFFLIQKYNIQYRPSNPI
jgi:hypothetical protein